VFCTNVYIAAYVQVANLAGGLLSTHYGDVSY